MTCSFKKTHETAVVCCLGTADSLFAHTCCKDCCHMQCSASEFSILFALAGIFAHSRQKNLKMRFRNSLVRADSPFSSYNPSQGAGRKEEKARETNLLINSQNRETWVHKILINQITSYLHILSQERWNKGHLLHPLYCYMGLESCMFCLGLTDFHPIPTAALGPTLSFVPCSISGDKNQICHSNRWAMAACLSWAFGYLPLWQLLSTNILLSG